MMIFKCQTSMLTETSRKWKFGKRHFGVEYIKCGVAKNEDGGEQCCIVKTKNK